MDKIIKYGLVILKNGKFLVNRKFGTKLFLMPGGKPEVGESIEGCLVREIKEEHAVGLVKDSIRHFGDFEDVAANEPHTTISIKVYLGKIIGEPTIGSEIEEQRWFGKNDNPDILSPVIKNKILPALIKENLLE